MGCLSIFLEGIIYNNIELYITIEVNGRRAMKVKNSIECYIIRVSTNGFTEILLLHKPKTDRHPAFWQPITGGIEQGEKPLDACIREVKEETNLNVRRESIEDLDFKFEIFIEDCDLVIKKSLFICRRLNSELEVTISDEHDDFMWSKIEDVRNYLFWDSNKNTFNKLYSILRST